MCPHADLISSGPFSDALSKNATMPCALATCSDIESAETRFGLFGSSGFAVRMSVILGALALAVSRSLLRLPITLHEVEQYFAVEFLAKNVFPQYLQVNLYISRPSPSFFGILGPLSPVNRNYLTVIGPILFTPGSPISVACKNEGGRWVAPVSVS